MPTLVAAIASALAARENCAKSGNTLWHEKHGERLEELVRNYLPSGSGWDAGTKLDYDKSTPERLIFFGSFHHMDESGGYDGWTDHAIVVTPSLAFGFNVTVKGKDRNDIKDYLTEMFQHCLSQTLTL
jgi:hypothetical protein